MLEPFTALSLASAVIQFVDFGSNIIAEGHKIRKSKDGAREEHVEIQAIAKDLGDLCTKLESKVAPHIIHSDSETKLQVLAMKCRTLAQELFELLEQLRVTSSGLPRTWDTFVKSVRTVWSHEKISVMQKRLDTARAQVNTHLLHIIRHENSSVGRSLADMKVLNKDMHLDVIRALDDIHATLSSQVNVQTDALQKLTDLQGRSIDTFRAVEAWDAQVKGFQKAKKELKDISLDICDNSIQMVHDILEGSEKIFERHNDETKRLIMEDRKRQQEECVRIIESQTSKLVQSVDQMARVGSELATSQQILKSLKFSEMPLREYKIKEAYSETFGWIFEESKTPFPDWLRHKTGVFWFNGKAGSGKSTLMKFVSKHSATESILKQWAKDADKKLVLASYYFWNVGTAMQRKQEGLLQSLLFQVLQQCQSLIPEVLAQRWSATDEHVIRAPWTREELIIALQDVIDKGESRLNARFCFFIDGLDEYEGDVTDHGVSYREMALELNRFARSRHVKLCVSSRPWTEFRDLYSHDRKRLLTLEKFTRPDMDRFVRGMLGTNDLFVKLSETEPRAQNFAQEILDRAQGVFLWVFLVVRSILRGLEKHDSIEILEKRLRRLPEDLERYFDHILKGIEIVYQDHTARTFQLAVRSTPLPLTAFWYLPVEMEDPNIILKDGPAPVTNDEAKDFYERARYNINAWCRDLLEVHDSSQGINTRNIFLYHSVEFLHRTVRDYLLHGEAQRMLNSRINTSFDPDLSIVRVYLLQAKSLNITTGTDMEMKPFLTIAHDVMSFAKEYETRHGIALVQLLEELDRTGTQFRASHRSHWTNLVSTKPCDFLAYAVSFGLTEFVKKLATERPQMLRTRNRWPLIDFALNNHVYADQPKDIDLPKLEMLESLINAGVDVNHAANVDSYNRTPWQCFLHRCFTRWDARLVPALQLMLRNGADLHASVAKRSGHSSTYYSVKLRQWTTSVFVETLSVKDCFRQSQMTPKEFTEVESMIDAARRASSWTSTFSSLLRHRDRMPSRGPM